jgi:hypothetical protein
MYNGNQLYTNNQKKKTNFTIRTQKKNVENRKITKRMLLRENKGSLSDTHIHEHLTWKKNLREKITDIE